jgi:serine/threonine-protein kinase
MSPEQCRGERNLTNKSDLYSLGVVFYELATGRKPFVAENAMEMFLLHVNGEFTRPSKLVLDLPVWFDNLICQLLEKDPQHRPLDAAMVGHTLGTIQEKVEAQLSAGVDVVRSRRIDRPRGQRKGDDTDREVARTLKTGIKKLKRKVRTPRFYERAWFMALGVVAVLVALATFSYFVFLAPPSLDSLHAQAKRLMDSNDAAKWDEALDGPLHQFDIHYPTATGEKADQMRRWEADAQYRQCFEQIKKHLQRVKEHKPHFAGNKEEEIAFPAALAEEAGDFDTARNRWEELNKEAGSSAWGVFAKQRLEEMNRADREDERLQKEINKIREFPYREIAADHPDKAMLTALRYELLGDYLKALTRFEELKAAYANDAKARVSYLFAARKVVEAKKEVNENVGATDAMTYRLNLLDKRLKEAQELKNGADRSEALALAQHIISLYGENATEDMKKEPEIQKRVAEANELRTELRNAMKLPPD